MGESEEGAGGSALSREALRNGRIKVRRCDAPTSRSRCTFFCGRLFHTLSFKSSKRKKLVWYTSNMIRSGPKFHIWQVYSP
jgi:hypothetical protein